MQDIRVQQSDYVKYALKSEISSLFWLAFEPIGWAEDQIELTRHKDYHGIMTSFTGELSFFKGAREYILNDFKALGMNSELQLHRYELRDTGEVVEWELDFVGIVDYSTMTDEYGVLKVKFNSNALEELLKTREGDDFELERTTSIHGNQIGNLETNLATINGVLLASETKMDIIKDDTYSEPAPYYWSRSNGVIQMLQLRGNSYQSAVLEMLSDTDDRISTPDTADPDADPASKMFYVDSIDPNVDVNTLLRVRMSFKVDLDVASRLSGIGARRVSLHLIKYQYNEVNLEYDEIENTILGTVYTNNNNAIRTQLLVEGQMSFDNVAWNQGFVIAIRVDGTIPFVNTTYYFDAWVREWSINVSSESTRTPSNDCEFLFVHDAMERLSHIITGAPNMFVSRMFGRVENGYPTDGTYGLVGIISGFWIRQFNSSYKLYKSMKMSIKDIIDSLNAVFNTGLGIEYIDGVKKIIVEDLKYFYQDKVIVTLTKDINNDKYKVIKEDYFSTLEIGYDKGGDYNNATGLDEPNVKTSWITPINRNKQVYRKVSKLRADDIGMEIIRRKPASLYPGEDTSQDDNNWFLDLKRDGTGKFVQNEWWDRLQSMPQGLSYAEDFKGMLFTPLRMLLRHGWIIRAGLEQAVNLAKYLSVNSSEASQTLGMFFRGDTKLRFESEDVPVVDLERSRVLPMEVTFTYPISDDLLKLILGKTVTEYENQQVSIPNYYFKFEWTNRKGEKERGFLTGLKPATNEFTFILANDNVIQ